MPHVTFILVPGFQSLAYVLACETLRIANKCAGRPVFTWDTRGLDDGPIQASNNSWIAPDRQDWPDPAQADLVLICAGYDVPVTVPARARAFLARASGHGAVLGAVDTGTVLLARLGYLNGRAAVVHHEAEASFREFRPDIDLRDTIFHFDGRILTAAGGTATGDAMLAWIAASETPDLAARCSEAMVHGRVREAGERQRLLPNTDPVLQEMVSLMHLHMETPLPLSELAARLGISAKVLRQRCARHLGQTPADYYLTLRLDTARTLVLDTQMSMTDIGLRCGFGSAAAFSRAFRNYFGSPPLRFRRQNSRPAAKTRS
ncbi:GlxA family transcriptional regulator [Lutimaribacter marinistellae]|uniref:GlxA family transcriptional regulator n=1 Tax=Lutimaribacter marinistellae TaxID=1820329 RepID=A0ABV7TIM7_9RHOB